MSGLAVAVSTAGAAQVPTSIPSDSFPILILEHRFQGPGPDSVLITLDKSRVYRVELLGVAGSPDIRPPGHGTPAFSALLDRDSRPGWKRYEMYPFAGGLHIARVRGLGPADTTVLRMYSDPSGSVAAQARVTRHRGRSWNIGIAASVGMHSQFLLQDAGTFAVADTAPSGLGAELTFVLASSFNPVAVALGASVEPISGARTRGTWFFVEPRVRVIRLGSTEGAVLLHLAQGSFSRSLINPVVLAGGLAITQRLSRGPLARGPAFQLRYFYGPIRNVAAQGQHAHHVWLGVEWTP